MTAVNFCYWLQGFAEITAANPSPQGGLTPSQLATVLRHLAMVFAHDIDPAAGPPSHQLKLDAIHTPATGGNYIVRC